MVEKLEGHHTSLAEVGYIVRGCAWSEMKKVWMMEAEESSKLGMMKNLMEGRYRARCVQVVRKELSHITGKVKYRHS